MLAAAAEVFCTAGYFRVAVEDIAAAAGVSRMTFYRHFTGKAAIAAELFRRNAAQAMPRFLGLGERDYRDRRVVSDWIAKLFEADRSSGRLLRVFVQANVEDAGFTSSAQEFLRDLIVGLGKHIPAFDLDPDRGDRKRWVEAWLLLYEILDQGNHAARGSGVANDRLVIEILTDRFVQFVEGHGT